MTEFPEPVDGTLIPRFAGIPTFMRLPIERDPAKLDIALVGVPFDGGTTNRAGARHGPREIRNMSSLMRRVHPVSRIAPYELCRIADHGDVPVAPVDVMASLATITEFYCGLDDAGARPLSVGGDHLISLPILRALARRRPLGMVHFDSHSDTTDSYFSGNRFTHGTPFRRAIEEGLLDPKRVVQIGVRGSLYRADEETFALDAGVRIIHIDEFFALGVDNVNAEARRIVGDGPVYVSFDVDAIDPAFAPGTGTPEIGGFSTADAQRMIRALDGLDLVGADVVEVSPPFDPSGMTALVGATLMFEILCVLAAAVSRGPR
jgi:guanidinopropionase